MSARERRLAILLDAVRETGGRYISDLGGDGEHHLMCPASRRPDALYQAIAERVEVELYDRSLRGRIRNQWNWLLFRLPFWLVLVLDPDERAAYRDARQRGEI